METFLYQDDDDTNGFNHFYKKILGDKFSDLMIFFIDLLFQHKTGLHFDNKVYTIA